MFEELNRNLINAKENFRKKQKYENMVKQTGEALKKELDRKLQLERILQDEDKDVKKLESLSIAGLFYSILGSKEQQLEKERQELLAARLKYNECCSSVTTLEKELESYKASLRSLIGADSEYETAFKRKEEFILKSNDINSQRLLRLMNDVASLEAQKKELQEAIASGTAAQNELERVLKSLNSAEGWGTWDMFGGGFLATSAKHSCIDEAREYAHYAKIALIRFQNELSDVDLSVDININIGSFETFADFFFDGLISDWIVQSKIHESQACACSIADNVARLMNSLNRRLDDVNTGLSTVTDEIRQLIEQLQV